MAGDDRLTARSAQAQSADTGRRLLRRVVARNGTPQGTQIWSTEIASLASSSGSTMTGDAAGNLVVTGHAEALRLGSDRRGGTFIARFRTAGPAGVDRI